MGDCDKYSLAIVILLLVLLLSNLVLATGYLWVGVYVCSNNISISKKMPLVLLRF